MLLRRRPLWLSYQSRPDPRSRCTSFYWLSAAWIFGKDEDFVVDPVQLEKYSVTADLLEPVDHRSAFAGGFPEITDKLLFFYQPGFAQFLLGDTGGGPEVLPQ